VKFILSLVLTLSFLVTGCVTEVRQTGGATTTASSTGKIGAIEIRLGHVTADSAEDFRHRKMGERMEEALRDQLRAKGKLDPRGAKLVVTVDDLCIHSTAAVVWVGMMAGRDQLEATAQVVENGKVVREFKANTKRFAGLLTGPGATHRSNLLCRHIADDLAQQL
jgi:hypothetical protein